VPLIRTHQDGVAQCFAAAQNLRTIHVNFPFEECAMAEPEFMMNDALHIIRQCPATVMQIGCQTKVWQVSYKYILIERLSYSDIHHEGKT
jgi:hypothetical protein